MNIDIVEFAESTLGLELKEYQKKILRTYYEHKDEATETLYLNISSGNKMVLIEVFKNCMDGK